VTEGQAAERLEDSPLEAFGAPRAPLTYAPTWLDPADVRKWLRDTGTPPASDDAEVDRVAAMTEKHVERCRPEWATTDDSDPPVTLYAPDAETYQGAVMYAARELRRRNSPAGVESFGDVGITFVAKYDPDIDRALHTGAYRHPGVG
jgi:hypothetical protein